VKLELRHGSRGGNLRRGWTLADFLGCVTVRVLCTGTSIYVAVNRVWAKCEHT